MLDPKTRELVAIGASVVAKCQPCLDYHLEEARKMGVSPADIRSAVSIARMVRKAGDQNMDVFVNERIGEAIQEPVASDACCSSEKCCG